MAINGHPKNIREMKAFRYIKTIVVLSFLAVLSVGCNSKEGEVIEELDVNRVFAPTDLEARIRNMTIIELSWYVREDAESYIVEFAEGAGFNNIIRTVEVSPDELPLQEQFDGETLYSARVKGVAEGKQDSKWVSVSIQTDPEQIFLPSEDGDIQATEATLRWPAGSAVTHLLINPGSVERPITPEEASAGIATITGLTGETEYTVVLYNNGTVRGTSIFTTLIDIGDATLLQPEDDLAQFIADAEPGDALVLAPGEFVTTGTIVLDKAISLKGLYPYDKPVLHVSFDVQAGADIIELVDLELHGTYEVVDVPTPTVLDDVLRFNGTDYNYTSLLISGCTVHDYARSFVAGNASNAIVGTVKIDNTVVSNVLTSGGDFIDFRNTHAGSIEITNSSFLNCSPGRDFIRADAGPLSGTGLTTSILMDRTTVIGSSTLRRLLYVRFVDNESVVSNSLFAETETGYYSNQGGTTDPTFSNNNYYNAPGFFDSANTKYDGTSTFTTLDPGFVDAANGDYTITNQNLIDDEIGDPRWRQ